MVKKIGVGRKECKRMTDVTSTFDLLHSTVDNLMGEGEIEKCFSFIWLAAQWEELDVLCEQQGKT